MKQCKKCNILLDVMTNNCPLCNSEIDDIKNFKSSYPFISDIINKHFFRKIILFLVCLTSLIVLVLNYFLTPTIKWSMFVILQLFLSYYIFYNILNGRKKVIKSLLALNVIVSSISVFWDVYTGFHGWSTNYVLPSLCISYGAFMLLLRFIDYFAFRESSNYIYLNICLEFVPMILVYLGYAKLNVLIYLSSIFCVLNLLILVIFDGSDLKEDILKKMHF
ncbi:MAG: hypothetical protein E7167_02495 [Firmicutes bacterium]|nr:hypothetical protein [Bacillota bacterium]